MRYCIQNQPVPHAHVVTAPVVPPALSAPVFSAPPTGGSGYNGAYGYGGGDGSYSGGPYDHGGHGGAGYEAVQVGQSPRGGDVGYDIPSRPPAAPDRGYHRSIQQAGVGEDGVAFAAEDGGHEDEGYFGGPLFSVFGGPDPGHGPTAYVLQLPTSGHSSGTGCDSRGPRRSIAVVTTATVPIGVRSSNTAAVVVIIVRTRSCDTTAAATVQHYGRSSSMAPAPSVALAWSRGALTAMDRP